MFPFYLREILISEGYDDSYLKTKGRRINTIISSFAYLAKEKSQVNEYLKIQL